MSAGHVTYYLFDFFVCILLSGLDKTLEGVFGMEHLITLLCETGLALYCLNVSS